MQNSDEHEYMVKTIFIISSVMLSILLPYTPTLVKREDIKLTTWINGMDPIYDVQSIGKLVNDPSMPWFWIPLNNSVRQAFQNHIWPQWKPYSGLGEPYAATFYMDIFSPTKLLFYYKLINNYGSIFLSNLLIGAFFSVLTGIRLKWNALAIYFSAVAFGLSTYFSRQYLPQADSTCWIPACAWATLCYREKTPGAIFTLAVIFSCTVFTGHIEASAIIISSFIIPIMTYNVMQFFELDSISEKIELVIKNIITLLIFFGITSTITIPTVDLYLRSATHVTPRPEVGGLDLRTLASLATVGLSIFIADQKETDFLRSGPLQSDHGNEDWHSGYAGPLVALLIVGCLDVKDKVLYFFLQVLVMPVVAILLFLPHGPLSNQIYFMSYYGVGIILWASIMLSANTLNNLLQYSIINTKHLLQRCSFAIAIFFLIKILINSDVYVFPLVLVGIISLFAVRQRESNTNIINVLLAITVSIITLVGGEPTNNITSTVLSYALSGFNICIYLIIWNVMPSYKQLLFLSAGMGITYSLNVFFDIDPKADLYVYISFILLFLISRLLSGFHGRYSVTGAHLAIAINVLVLAYVTYSELELYGLSDQFSHNVTSSIIREITDQNKKTVRITGEGNNILQGNSASQWKLTDPKLVSILYPCRYVQFLAKTDNEDIDQSCTSRRGPVLSLQSPSMKGLRLLGVDLVVKNMVHGQNMTSEPDDREALLVENIAETTPEIFYRTSAFVCNGKRQDIIDYIFTENFDPLQDLILEPRVRGSASTLSDDAQGDIRVACPKSVENDSTVRIEWTARVERSDSSGKIQVNSDGAHWLVWLDRYDENWRAKIDGNEVPIWMANGIFRAIFMPSGNHTAVFWYESLALRVGYVLGTLTIVIALAGSLIFAVRAAIWKQCHFIIVNAVTAILAAAIQWIYIGFGSPFSG